MAENKDWIQKLQDLRGDRPTSDVIVDLLLLPVVAFFLQLANVLEAILNLIIVPLGTMIDGVEAFLSSLFGIGDVFGGSDIISEAARISASKVEVFGLFSFPVGVALFLSVLALIAGYLRWEATGDTVPGIFTDLPLVGTEEEE
jgi:hypothetical protein